MKLVHAELVLSKQQAVIEVFKGTLETTALRVLQDNIIKQMLDSGCLTIEKVIDEEYDNVFIRVKVLVENHQLKEVLMTSIKEITNHLLANLKSIGAIKWHTSTHGSIYIKFKDVRLGSIRISDHKGRTQYNYTYELTDISTSEAIDNVIKLIKAKSRIIPNFNPEHYIVFDPKQRGYKQLDNFEQYKDHILKR